RLGARPRLPDDQRELAVEIAARDLARRLLYDLGDLRIEAAEPRIHPRRGLLDEAERVDDLERHLLFRPKREILDRALGLRAPIGIRGDLDRPEAVGLGAGGSARHWTPLRREALLLFFARKVHVDHVRAVFLDGFVLVAVGHVVL